jgi:putative transposase
MSRSGECLDNAMAERSFATRKAELVARHHWATRAAARTAIFAWIEVFSNRPRAHSALAYRPPATFEAAMVVLRCPAA